MTKEQQLEIFEKTVDKIRKTLRDKGDDYAGDVDRLYNFKAPASMMKTTATEIVLAQVCHKVTRLVTLIRAKQKPKNESIADSMLDLQTYSFLTLMCALEEGLIQPERGRYEQTGRQVIMQESTNNTQPEN